MSLEYDEVSELRFIDISLRIPHDIKTYIIEFTDTSDTIRQNFACLETSLYACLLYTSLGVAWSVLNPLLMMIVLAAVFSVVFRGTIEPFPVYLILGQTLFTFMSDATSGAMGSIIESAPLIKKIRINKMLFPLEKVMFALLNFAISLIAVAIVMVFFQVVPTFNILLLPVLLAYLFMFSLGLGLLLAALSVFFRDIMHLWGVILTAWTYATPLFYSCLLYTSRCV